MASYLDRLITLDEEGTENLETDFEAEQTQDITEVIDMDTNSDEINDEAVSIEEDIEAMNAGAEAVGELAEQESVNEELLDNPGDISPEVAKATNDAFKVTLAALAIDVRDTTYGNITYDSNRNEPIQVVRITQDGVKDFMSKIKEHIIAFFRTIKAKIQRLIAKLFIMFSDVSKKGEALHKQLKGKLERLKNKSTSTRGSASIDVSNHSTKAKILEYMPLWFIEHDGSIAKAIKALECRFARPNTEPYASEIAEKAVSYALACTCMSLNNTVSSSTCRSTANGVGSLTTDPKQAIKTINTLICNKQGDFFNNVEFIIDAPDKKNHETSNCIIAGGLFSKTLSTYAFRLHEDSDELIPTIVWSTSKIPQTEIDKCNIKDVTPDDIKNIIECAIQIGKQSKGMCDAGYKHLDDASKTIVKIMEELGKDGDIKNGTLIRASSVWRSLIASIAFKSIMDQAKAGRRVLSLANYLYNQLDKDYKEDKKEEKRTRRNNS